MARRFNAWPGPRKDLVLRRTTDLGVAPDEKLSRASGTRLQKWPPPAIKLAGYFQLSLRDVWLSA